MIVVDEDENAGWQPGRGREGESDNVSDEAKRSALASELWRRMFGFLMYTAPRREAVLERLGLTPNESRALSSLDIERGRTMGELAAAWRCDASTATWTVNRLERLGLAERQPHPSDRRVRLVVLTPAGVRTRAELLAGMFATPPELQAFTDDQLRALTGLLAVLPVADEDHPRGK